MARGKKKETLTPEERLQAALVPESEQPYKVPENWCWTALKHISSHISDGSHNPPKDSGKGIPLLSATNIRDHLIDIDSAVRWITEDQWTIENQRTKIETNDVLLTIVASIGRTAVVKNEQFALQRSVAVIKPKINSEFLSYYFESPYIQQFMLDNAKGTAQKGFYLNSLVELFCCVPPLAEQQRIVDRIESLFAKLDEAKQKAQDALDSFETRKAAILHRAFTGELTAQWRKEHGVGMESWKEETLESVCYSIFDGDHMPPPKSEQGIPFLVISNVNTGHLSFENTRFVPESYYEALSDTRKPEYGDVLYTLVGSYGIPVIVDREHPFCFQRHMALLKPKNIDSYYLWYILQSREMFEKATQIATGTAQLTVPIKGLRQLKFNCASANEQGEIVRILDDLLAKEQQAKDAAEGVLEQIDLIKKAILARAFRGELGTNDPSEESAVELVKRAIERGEKA